MQYEMLFSPLRIGPMEIKNRIAMTAMGVNLAAPTGEATPAIIRYYEERAEGGTGLIITEITRVDDVTGIGLPGQLSATDLRHIPGLERLADAVHRHGAKLFVQLHHPGKETSSRLLGGVQPVSASAIPNSKDEMPRELSTEEVEELVKRFVAGAMIASAAGMDGVEIHAAHSYLVNQFLSPKYNRRTDQYGGSPEKRMRFLLEIIGGIKALCPGLALSVRISADEFIEGGNRLEDGLRIAKAIEEAGADAINVSNGVHESGVTIMEPYTYPEGWKKHLAKAIKGAVRIPVIAANTIKHPDFAESLLQDGVSDMVGLGRCHLADPQWANKARRGEADLIRSCVGCMQCFGELTAGRHIACAINPRLGSELEYAQIPRDGCGRTAAVVGGGPSGMEAARVLALRGFVTTLFEKAPVLGGTLNLANKSPHKDILGGFMRTAEKEMRDAGVDVLLNTEADAALLKTMKPDVVIIASGAVPIVPGLPGVEHALTYEEVLSGRADTGPSVLVVGGGLTGLETAEFLAARGKKVRLIEMTDTIGAGVYASVLYVLTASLQKLGVEIHKQHKLLRIEEGQAIVLCTLTGEEKIFPCDTVVLALGLRPRSDSIQSLKDAFPDAAVVGDAVAARRIMEAMKEGFARAFAIKPQ